MDNRAPNHLSEEHIEELLQSGDSEKVKSGISKVLQLVKRGAMPLIMATAIFAGCGKTTKDPDPTPEREVPTITDAGVDAPVDADNCSGWVAPENCPGYDAGN